MVERSVREALLALEPADLQKVLGRHGIGPASRLVSDWAGERRPEQQPPPGDWDLWLILAGRGFGKTRAGAGWVHGLAKQFPGARIALVGATAHDVRSVMVEGESGLLATAAADARPAFEPSLRRLVWPGGAQGLLFSAAEPESLRGPQFDFGWGDEVARWDHAEAALANLRLGLRLGVKPRLLLTTTPRPWRWLKAMANDRRVAMTRGATWDNAANLPPAFVQAMLDAHGGTRLGRQELAGEIIDDIEGALWTRALLEACRVRERPPLVRVVVGVDPPAGAGAAADACGIVVVGLGGDGNGYVLADASVQGLSPERWAAAVAAAASAWDADRVIAEVNQGGDMVTAVLHAVNSELPVKPVRAAHGKVTRAEPVAALYAAGRVAHVGGFASLEDELCGLLTGGEYAGPGRSPDRADALVWALTELLLGGRGEPGIKMI